MSQSEPPEERPIGGATVRGKLTVIVVACVGFAFAVMVGVEMLDTRKSLHEVAHKNYLAITQLLAVQVSGGVRWKKVKAIERAYSAFRADRQSSLAGLMTFDVEGTKLTEYRSESRIPYDLSDALKIGAEALAKNETLTIWTDQHFVIVAPIVAGKNKANIGALAVAWAMEDLRDRVSAAVVRQIGLASLALAALVGVMIFLLDRTVSRPLRAMTDSMTRLAQGDTSITVPAAGRRDEIGAMAQAVQVFKENAIRMVGMTGELRNHAEQLEQALAKEKEYNVLQREFVSMASHEFRTPLTIIDGAAQRILRHRDRLTQEALEQRVEKIREAVKRMTGLIDSTLSVSRLEAGKIQMYREACDIAETVTRVCKRQRQIANSHDISYQLDDLPDTIYADPKLLDQIFTNLLSNAVKYSPNQPDITVRGWTDGGSAVVAVRDHGLGVPAAEIQKLFQRYFRATTSTGIAGTGIGLHLVKQLVEMHGGSIAAESVERQGSTFIVSLPTDLRDDATDGNEAGECRVASTVQTTLAATG